MSPAITLPDEIAELRTQRKAELIDEAMQGRGNFWNTDVRDPDCHDAEQEYAIFRALRQIMAMPTLKDETRWQLLMELMRKGCVADYAELWTRET